ncbi:(3R)-hydroxyacyl-ACP dehydratase subunit HadC [Mycobacterium sp. CBMA293]|uniref:(3R)-hydroxyacyl-ACP dehydratase subunit HadC n=2 Tax=Mycolicibacterium TaxID=1866885 RepID=UPI0012DFE042|nr:MULTISPECIES: (3R)-hydroxyacyl-ACP dehydratase subunit HadC [unclassified Mycolicibacterium]MUL44722.1 (3R)-hydroxyacyl-ACP dehydratase subunit HadC [Mycolicibacterium sp. CBMA 360]MUL60047.1 (3R)-hydroxyacyl-ACP dehydratase subunit HadC [Mycolicibacterium sp. CBMA 335]MUL68890.1 (3R)-hydroxyacyl-ACP dehydratase subunit HadC [Mycolicibacterium sp. CBMA 311]MUL93719.1 (3R)-hydroxyacyl-ACP dehydratase subunit HadC [Mycolicibacterium sp. CBMA 230]MUM05962.1 3-hydroxyacyl-ACP dehydratase [Mycol
MSLKADILGMVHKYPEVFTVGREQVRQFAKAIKSEHPASMDEAAAAELGHDTLVAGPTFVSIVALLVQQDFFRKVDLGMDTMQIIQVDQKFVYHRPIKVGDRLHATVEFISVDHKFGADIVVTRNTLTDDDGGVIMEAFTTLMGHEGDNSVGVHYDRETGQVLRSAAKAD